MRRLVAFSFVVFFLFAFTVTAFAQYPDDALEKWTSLYGGVDLNYPDMDLLPMPDFLDDCDYWVLCYYFDPHDFDSDYCLLGYNEDIEVYTAYGGIGSLPAPIFRYDYNPYTKKWENYYGDVTPVAQSYIFPIAGPLYPRRVVLATSVAGYFVRISYKDFTVYIDNSTFDNYFQYDEEGELGGIFSGVVSGFLNGLKSLFIPSVNILSLIVDKFTNKFPIINQVGDLFTSLFNPGTDEPIFKITYNGMTLKIIDFTMFSDYMPLIRNFTGVFLLLSFLTREVKKLPRLLRGRD